MDQPEDIISRKLRRETAAREEAERLLEEKSLELFLEAKERQRALEALRDSEERYRMIVELSPDAILMAAAGSIVFANEAAKRLFRETETALLIGKSMMDLAPPERRAGIADSLQMLERSGTYTHTEEPALRLDGSIFEVSVRRVPLIYAGKPAIQIIARDISRRKALERQVAYQAAHDTLTGTVNRSALLDQLIDAISYADRYGFPVWVAFLDLDRFKQINDRFGHHAGDQILISMTTRLRSILRKSDVLGRYGGDEFVLVMRSGPEGDVSSNLIERLMQTVCEPVKIDEHELRVTCSLGIAIYPLDGKTPDELLAHADAAMYRAKESGRNLYQFYDSEINARLIRRHQVEAELANALDRGELHLAYQPQIALSSGKVEGAEALLRWNNPALGSVNPDEFIPLAEETSLINRIGAWVVREACQQSARWEREGLGALRVAVNLSARQLNGLELLDIVQTALQDSGLPPERLELELTETLMMSDVDLTLKTLQELHRMGVQVAIDDFGTGYSSFVYLQRLPLSSMKIDREFVQALTGDGGAGSRQIVSTLIQLAHSLKLRVVAEGVENPAQLAFLREQGCDEIQGYLHSKPEHANEFAALIRHHQPQDWC